MTHAFISIRFERLQKKKRFLYHRHSNTEIDRFSFRKNNEPNEL